MLRFKKVSKGSLISLFDLNCILQLEKIRLLKCREAENYTPLNTWVEETIFVLCEVPSYRL